jgi:hypothetical protein
MRGTRGVYMRAQSSDISGAWKGPAPRMGGNESVKGEEHQDAQSSILVARGDRDVQALGLIRAIREIRCSMFLSSIEIRKTRRGPCLRCGFVGSVERDGQKRTEPAPRGTGSASYLFSRRLLPLPPCQGEGRCGRLLKLRIVMRTIERDPPSCDRSLARGVVFPYCFSCPSMSIE